MSKRLNRVPQEKFEFLEISGVILILFPINPSFGAFFGVFKHCHQPTAVLSIATCILPFGFQNNMQEVCLWKSFEATCKPDEVVIMTHARYGRMQLGRCITKNMGHLGCSADVLPVVETICSGRTTCSFSVPDSRLDSYKPCSELQSYLEASFRCQRVQTIRDSICHTCDFVRTVEGSGYISNLITRETGCGSTECPWRIAADPGQQIQVTLLDYGVKEEGAGLPTSSVCKVYAVLKEGNPARTETVCGGLPNRHRIVYVSQTHSLEIRVRSKSTSTDDHFLLHYKRMSVAIIAGVAFVICALVVTIGLGCYKLRNSSRPHQHHHPQPSPEDIYQRSLHRAEEIHLTYTAAGLRDYKEPCVHHTLERHKDTCDFRHDLAHIWETPLPHEPPNKLHTLQHHV
ncbi:hypothetical protein CAPTEDRAFT_221826 [Capitella teleta]|uniref:SUEL-type lectin domain-containing protein n=1 Tax=Capitella teleta TaxID=283909 RepID=R7UV07_CAPTE|nr:hypothetical protein CAPTEDRAFT_221826 [Capitella teleta]|eukprot:ELU09978.1 hypothetical protein CAPTEDRAFT_221826 [Capitella teleta]